MTVAFATMAWAATKAYTTIDSVSISLSYDAFHEGSTEDEGYVSVSVPDAHGLYDVTSTKISVPTNGWKAGDVPNFRITLTISDEDNYRFSSDASKPDGISVDGGEAHYGQLQSSGRKVYYEIYLYEVGDDDGNYWESDEHSWNDDDYSGGGPGAASTNGAWLKDPTNNRYWYSLSNGTRPVHSWMKIGSLWYYFDNAGYRVDNAWVKWQNGWYYLGGDGAMYTDRRTPDGYYVNSQGLWDGRGKS